jgi:hypothetical protein
MTERAASWSSQKSAAAAAASSFVSSSVRLSTSKITSHFRDALPERRYFFPGFV